MTKLFFIYAFVLPLLSFLFVKGENDISNTFFKFENCNSTSTFPSIGENGIPQYGAENALTRGSGYWCSEGKHNSNEIVSWIGHLKNVRSLNGIIIHWAYSPGEISVLASYDGNDPYEEVVPYQVIDSRGGNVVQNIIFNHVVMAKSIKLNMRHPIHEYFGINFVNVLGSRDPTLRIQSGMSSVVQDLCLQIDDTNEVVLDGCITSMSYMDGRDLWKLNAKNQIYNPITNLCISLKDNMTANGGRIIMEDCNASIEHNDGRSSWQLLPNNQLKMLRDGNFCLSQDGSKSGSIDVALNKHTTSTLSKEDKKYSTDKAVDGNLDTFWLSQPFTIDTAPDSVYFNINLGSIYKLQKCVIDWRFPATKYSIMISNDGKNFKEISINLANFLSSTINNLHNLEGQYVKLKFMAPNPEFAQDQNLFYGIKKLSIYTNRIKSVVDDCDTVKNSEDARDKYFFEFVSEINMQEGKELKRLDGELQQYAEKIQNEALKIQKLNPQLKKCKSGKEKRHNDIINIKNIVLKNIYDVINESQKIIKINSLNSNYSTSTKEIGQTSENPADDCFHLKKTLPNSPSGFYYVLPSCSQNVLRVYCDMKIGATYYIPSVDTNLISKIKHVENVCASYGLNPIHLHNESQIYELKKLFQIMEINIENPVPLAVRGKGTKEEEYDDDELFFFSLDFQENVTNIVSKFGTPTGNTFGIDNQGVVFFDSSNSEMSAFVCSNNVNSINLSEPFLNFNCQTSLKESSEIKKLVGNEYLIKCPHDCLEREIEASVVGGEGNIYSDESSICLSAIHAGVYDKHYLIHLRVVNALGQYEGVFQNGIISESYINENQEVAFKLFNIPPKCPGNNSDMENFVFLESDKFTEDLDDKENVYVDPSTADAINDLVTIVNKQVGSTDPSFLALINKQAIQIISNARRYLKPTELFEKNMELLSDETLKDVQKVSHTIKLLTSKITSEVEKRKYKLEALIDERLRQKEFESWKLNSAITKEDLYNVFEVINSLQLQQGGKWDILDNPLNEGMTGNTLTQNARVVNMSGPHDSNRNDNEMARSPLMDNQFIGSYSFLRYKSFYDFIFSTYVHVKGTGSVGIIFRAYDKYNYYMLELNNSFNGFKRLLKFENNEATELAIINETGFDENSWFALKIECIGAKIKISTIRSNGPIYELPTPDIVVNDDFNSAGTVGFYTYGVDSVEFTKPTVESVECLSRGRTHKNVSPLTCNVYEEFFLGKFNKSYAVFDPENAVDGPSKWNYATNVANEKQVILQNSNMKGDKENEIPSLTILQEKICQSGIFNFSIYPKCTDGIVGAVFKFLDSKNYTLLEIGPNFTRLRQNLNGTFHVLAKSIVSGYKQNTWNRVTISFSSSNINVNMGSGLMTYPIFSLIGLDLQEGQQIGFTSHNCNHIAFSHIFLHPFDFKPYSPTPSIGTESMLPIFSTMKKDTLEGYTKTQNDASYENEDDTTASQINNAEIEKHKFEDKVDNDVKKNIHFCATHKDIIDRMAFCDQYEKENNSNCTNNFCNFCCENIDSSDHEDTESCIELCQELDDKVIQTSEILNHLKKSCVEFPSDKLKQECEKDVNQEECLTDMCQMCCQSVPVPEKLLTNNVDMGSLIDQCISLC
ncbi:LCCL domain-containing protein [Plasmodium gonderi]|uniref:LCCL domain-containing protein n=1 Tax=Plasmodium gonderi TaxID=77519 RepID=A0A1Y1JLN1_PLAGO|nr:LCCL domain-containing protein [Plasmodium gonderi]GAW82528.1 LCCL domain-containing protein [Plasmodium gonderi]